jgi:hypothetical protein
MPAVIPVVITDDLSASFTFAPVSSNGTTATFRTNSQVSRDLESTLKITVTENKTRQRVALKLTKPVSSIDINGNIAVKDEIIGQVEFMAPHAASDVDRETVVQLLKSALDNAMVKAVAESGEGLW